MCEDLLVHLWGDNPIMYMYHNLRGEPFFVAVNMHTIQYKQVPSELAEMYLPDRCAPAEGSHMPIGACELQEILWFCA